MIQIGRYNKLPVFSTEPHGVYLGTEAQRVLLPARYVPEGTGPGDVLEVFVYTDSDDIPVATTERPLLTVGGFAFLEVVDQNRTGAFLNWGLPKDLLLPYGRQHRPVRVGERVVVAASVHQRTQRVIASTILAGHFDDEVSHLEVGRPVDLMVYGFNDLGALVIVDGRHAGLVYRNQTFQRLRIGQRLQGYVSLVRDDHRLDISLSRPGRAGIQEAGLVILDALEAAGGRLDLHDKSPPEQIRARLGMSKKAFKQALGGLYRDGLVLLESDGVQKKA